MGTNPVFSKFVSWCYSRTKPHLVCRSQFLTSHLCRPKFEIFKSQTASLRLPSGSRSDKRSRITVTWKSTGIALGVGFALTAFVYNLRQKKELMLEKERTRSLGKAHIGGPWELVDHHGKPTSSADFLGRWTIIYFGFTHCPDVCPDEIEKICKVVDIIDSDKNVPDLTPLFITVDPSRDNVQAVAEYIKEFSPKIIGLTGTTEQVGKAARAYRIYFSEGPKDSDDDYIVDHSIISYLVDPNGQCLDFYGQVKTINEMSNSIKLHMVRFEHNK